jgi:L-rhamnonate dehydratase
MKESLSHFGKIDRRKFLRSVSLGLAWNNMPQSITFDSKTDSEAFTIKNIRFENGIIIEASDGTIGHFAGSESQDSQKLKTFIPEIKELLVGKDPFDRNLEGEMLWEGIYPGKARLYEKGFDPLTGLNIANKPRGSRHTSTGQIFIAFSTVDIALWDLRAKLRGQPAYRIIGNANRDKIQVYWRPGEATNGIKEACQRARDAFDSGYNYQKWYFTKSAKDGKEGFKENVELVRSLREELPDANLMFDNHSIRYYDDINYSVELCKAISGYEPFWIEEPICPEHLEGYKRIKGETGVTIAGGEHLYTKWPVKAFLDNKCLDYVQSDPIWCGGISEWLKICDLVNQYPGVKMVPHITSPWIVAPHCVASQSVNLCPILEYNFEGGRQALANAIEQTSDGNRIMKMPVESGIS